MADVTRAATPITNRNIIQPQRESRSANEVPFDFQDTSKVKQAAPQSDMQENANILRQDGSTTGFYQVLHDPDVSSVFLKSIFLLREIVDILPMNNTTQTEEMQELLNNLVLNPDEIVGEMMRQEDISTLFKGGLFDMLREITVQNSNHETEQAVTNFLKAVNGEATKESVLNSLVNNLSCIREQVSASPNLSAKLDSLLEQLINLNQLTDSMTKLSSNLPLFSQVKSEVLSTFKDIESSIIYSDDIAKQISLATYNMSRISTSDTAVSDAFSHLLTLMQNDTDKENITNLLLKFIDENDHVSHSKTMNALTEILQKQSDSPEIKMLNTDSIDKIIHSLLSSPCNFTPLLHYVIPVNYEDTQSMAEMWINPDGKQDLSEDVAESVKNCSHVLVVFEIEDIGKFEAELFVMDKNIDLSIMCPEEYTDFYKGITRDIRQSLNSSTYKLKKINVEKLKEPRSLIEVFKFLPERRAGVNVTI